MHTPIPKVLLDRADLLTEYCQKMFPSLAPLAGPCFLSTIDTTIQILDSRHAFVITGDIPAMWLRDSAAQVTNYIPYAKESGSLRSVLEGVIQEQAELVCIDPYANAFNSSSNGHGAKDNTLQNDRVWERKYEVDSLCAPIFLAHRFWKETGFSTAFSKEFHTALQKIAAVFACEQNHSNSPYFFERPGCPADTLPRGGKGDPVAFTGMTWSGFRPSDDRCAYGYLVPANMMACVALEKAAEISDSIYRDAALSAQCRRIKEEINAGIQQHAIVRHKKFGEIYAYETDGTGNYLLMDDANSPSLLAMPYLEYCSVDDTLYQNTRRFILSSENPFYYQGRYAHGIGSPHTEKGYIWPIALIMQAITSQDEEEICGCLTMLAETHAGTNLMHESFDPNAPEHYSRPWFAWANTLFATLLEKLMDENFSPCSHRDIPRIVL